MTLERKKNYTLNHKIINSIVRYTFVSYPIQKIMSKTSVNLSSYCPAKQFQYAGTCYAYAAVYSGMSTEFNILNKISDRQQIESTYFSSGVVASYHNSSLIFYKRSKTCDQLGTVQKALDILEKRGTVFITDFDCQCMAFSAIKKQVPSDSHWQRISGYKRLKVHNAYSNNGIQWIKDALQKNHPVMIGMWQNDFVRQLKSKSVNFELPDQATLDHVKKYRRGISNHAACILGYNDAYEGSNVGCFLVKNNFEKWGDGNGFCWIPYTYLMPLIYEAYFISGLAK